TSSARPKDPVFVKSSADNSEISNTGSNKPKLSEAEDSTLSNHDTGKVPSNESKRNTTDHSIVVSNSSATDYDSADESSVCSIPLPPLEKLTSAEPVSGPKTIKSILKSKSTFKAETLKGITINEPSSAPARGNKSSLVSKTNSASAKLSKTCGSNVHTTSDHNDIEWFRKKGALQDKKAESFKASKTESSSALRSKTPTKSPPAQRLNNLKEVFFLTPTGGIYGEVGVNTFRNAIGAHYLSHSSKYVAPSSIDIVRPWFETIGYGEVVPAKGTLKKSLLPPRWSLVNGINIDYASIFWEDIIIKLNKKHREKVVPYTRFLSLLMMHKMKEGYRDRELTLYPTQVFSVNNWALKPNQPEEPPFITYMLAICSADKPVAKEETKGVSSKAPTGSKTGHSRKRKESSSAIDSNPSQPPVSTPVDTGMHKEDQQVTGGLTSLEVTTSFIIHSESALGNDALVASMTEADPINSAPNTDPHVLADQTKFVSEGLETILTQPITGKGANSVARQIGEEISSTIKLEDLAKLVSHVQPRFKDLDSPEDDPVIVVDDSDEDEDDEVHATENSQKHKLKLEKNKAEAEAALLKAQPLFPNVEQLKELLEKSFKTESSNILSAHDFSSSLPTELKDLPSKLNELTGEVASVQAKLTNLDALPSLLLNVIQALNKFAQVLNYASLKAGDQSVPSAGQADTMLTEGEKNTNQVTISLLFQRRAEKNVEKENLNN
ncbi:hypothetical protein Tco_0764860, partial [Tanacetum coccineum]